MRCKRKKEELIGKLLKCIDECVDNGWEQLFLANVETKTDGIYLFGHKLLKHCGRSNTNSSCAFIVSTQYNFKNPYETLNKLESLVPGQLPVLKCALARVVAAKPHSADVKRLISKKFKNYGFHYNFIFSSGTHNKIKYNE